MPVQPPPTVSRFAVSGGGKGVAAWGTPIHVRAGRTGAPRSCSRARAHHPSTHTPDTIVPVAGGPARAKCLAGPFRAVSGGRRSPPPPQPGPVPSRAGFPPELTGARPEPSTGFPGEPAPRRPGRDASKGGGRIRPARPLPRISGSPGGHGRPGVPQPRAGHSGAPTDRMVGWAGGGGGGQPMGWRMGGRAWCGGGAWHGVGHCARIVRARRRGAGTQGVGSAWGDMAGERSERRPFGWGPGGRAGALRGGGVGRRWSPADWDSWRGVRRCSVPTPFLSYVYLRLSETVRQ